MVTLTFNWMVRMINEMKLNSVAVEIMEEHTNVEQMGLSFKKRFSKTKYFCRFNCFLVLQCDKSAGIRQQSVYCGSEGIQLRAI